MKGVRLRYSVTKPWDGRIDWRAVAVVALPFFCMMVSDSDHRIETDAKLGQCEAIVDTDMREFRERLDAYRVWAETREGQLRRSFESAFGGNSIVEPLNRWYDTDDADE